MTFSFTTTSFAFIATLCLHNSSILLGVEAAHNSVDVTHNFLDETEIKDFLNIDLPFKKEGHISAHGVAENLAPAFVRRILNKAGITPKEDPSSSTSIILTEIFEGETPRHQDHHWNEDRDLVEGKAGFIFLNSNPDAEFVHGDERVPVVAGSMVTFAGDVVHNTVVRSGSVRMAGPFHVSPTLDVVGPATTMCTTDADCTGTVCPVGQEVECECDMVVRRGLAEDENDLSPKEQAVQHLRRNRELSSASSPSSLSLSASLDGPSADDCTGNSGMCMCEIDD